MSSIEKIRKRAESDLGYFAQLVNPLRYYGDVHREIFEWCTRPTAKKHQLLLLPRDHQKSHIAAVKCAWEITRDPTSTHLYVSSASHLAVKQLYAIKQILLSDVYRRYWPEMVKTEEGRREKWTTEEIIVDHPLRKKAQVRDSTVSARGLTAVITGLHCSHIWLDDLVEPSNAYTEEGRTKVANLYSQLASIETTAAQEFVVGTRYYPTDLYQQMKDLEHEVYDDNGEIIGKEAVYEIFERVVEQDGIFLWPKKFVPELGKNFGFDNQELSTKYAKYIDKTQFYAQYYNNPNDPSLARINKSKFQYYDPRFLKFEGGKWEISGERLNVYAAMDFAFTLSRKADWTAIVVIGITSKNQVYVLDIDRFKTDRISEYYSHLLNMYKKWNFRKVRAETVQAQKAIVRDLKETFIENGIMITIDEFSPSRALGAKEERMASTLEPRYDNMSIWHYRGGLCSVLEEELIMANPPHDDIKDALTCAIDVAVAPNFHRSKNYTRADVVTHPRFGGIKFG